MPALSRLELENFKSHAHTALEFDRMTLLVGANGSGKTSVLEAAHAVGRLVVYKNSPYVALQEHKDLATRGRTSFGIEAEGSTSEPWSVSVGFARNPNAPPSAVWRAQVQWRVSGQEIPQTGQEPIFPGPLQSLAYIQFFRLEPDALAAPCPVTAGDPILERTGQGLAAVLSRLKLYNDEAFEAVTADLRSIIGTIKKVHLDRIKGPEGVLEALRFDTILGDKIPASSMSSGTLVLLGLITALHYHDSASLLLIDDLQHALHPKAQLELMRLLKRLLETKPKLQIIATTHSPYIVDEVEPEAVWVFALSEDGVSRARRLTDHPDAARSLSALTAGELWSARDEAWVLEEKA